MAENMVKDFFTAQRPQNGLTYDEYSNKIENELNSTDLGKLNETDKSLYDYTNLNIHRSSRIHKTYKPSEELISVISQIDEKQIWMVITEGWCGDSAQNLPHIAMISQLNPNIDLRIILRDENLDIMDEYLTNGTSRSIPKLVVFDKDGNELFQWGPRPVEAQELVNELKKTGLSKKEFAEKLHLWYGRNRGKAIDSEFVALLNDKIKEKLLIENN